MNFGQILLQLWTNIYNSILPLLRKLRASSRPFYALDKMTVKCSLPVFNCVYYYFS